MMQNDSNFSIWFSHECPGFIHCGQLAAAVDEINIAHGDGQIAMQLNHLIADRAFLPGLDGKAFVIGKTGIPPHEIGQRACLGSPKSLWILGQRWFEGHSSILIAIGLIENLPGQRFSGRETTC